MLVYEVRDGAEKIFLLDPAAVVAVQGSLVDVEGEDFHCLLRFANGSQVETVGSAAKTADEIHR